MQAGHQVIDNKQIIWFNSDDFSRADGRYFEADYWQQRGQLTGQSSGRGTAYFFQHQGVEYVLRHYHRGGLIGKLIEDSYWYKGLARTRAWRELQLLLRMNELGLPVPKPAAARVKKHGLFYRADLILHRLAAATDIHHLLCQSALPSAAWKAIGRTIRQMHNAQIYHHDLNIHNIMRDQTGKIWLIDFDKCAFKNGEKWKIKNLNRLQRSLKKEQQRMPEYHLNQQHWQALLEGYQTA